MADVKPAADALAALSASITPAVLILGTSSLIGATSSRLGRVLDRIRKLVEQLEQAQERPAAERNAARCTLLRNLLTRSAMRAWLLQHSMTALYVALGSFVATSVALGFDAAIGLGYARLLAVLGLTGVVLLLAASLLLIFESRIAILAINQEIAWVIELSSNVPADDAGPPADSKSASGVQR